MKYLYFSSLLSILSLTACYSPKNLVSVAPEPHHQIKYYQGNKIVYLDQNELSMKINYSTHNSKEIVFDVEIINKSENDILVNPVDFNLTFNSINDAQNIQKSAYDPEIFINELEIKALKRQAKNKNKSIAIAGLAVGTAALSIATNSPDVYDPTFIGIGLDDSEYNTNNQPIPGEKELIFPNEYYFWSDRALRITELEPGRIIYGKLVFPFVDKYSKVTVDWTQNKESKLTAGFIITSKVL